MAERTFSIIKPDAVAAGKAGAILSRLEQAGFKVVALRMRHLTVPEAQGFYHVHRERPFFGDLCQFMSSRSSTMVMHGPEDMNRQRSPKKGRSRCTW